jgi:sterol desaturase/sphingolipid hydroxylase (fatty acid hydroxylase superfamily)
VTGLVAIIVGVGAGLVALERFFPARALPRVRGWWWRVALLQAALFGVVFLGHHTWDVWLHRASVWRLELSPFAGGLVAYGVGTFVLYWWHRARHAVPLLWVVFHRLHHSPQRVEALTAFFVHPAEMISGALLNTFLVQVVLGLGAEANAWCNLWISLAGFFYHMNLRTPRWVGYFVQRPEMHWRHHELGRHAGNYSDLPIWDHLFGTYVPPEGFSGEFGFGPDEARRFPRILLFQKGDPAES